jgi:phage minor structural protein
MQTTFLNAAGVVLFSRDDMEQGTWTQEEYTVNATFPYVAGKVIERGQRISFRAPATGSIEIFEIRNVTNIEPEHYQQIIAEHIAVAELSDEHIDTTEITSVSPASALTTVLSGTLWSVGTSSVPNTQSVDISRGSVWQAVCDIETNWNVYIKPRVVTNAAGNITGRYLDIAPAEGVWRGVRLSIDKNMSDSSVTYDDTEVYTALYGYGGSVSKTSTTGDDTTETLTFADAVWTKTNDHPAKPYGQTYLEDPDATALYGRNGRPRFGYYQNGDIDDADTLLAKTWETLQETNKPKISITGTVSDLYRFGYKDEPIDLHDMVCVEIAQTGEKFYLEVIKNDVDLIDPTATRPEIGSYIANIVYITRETETTASGGGSGGGSGQKPNEYKESETFAALEKTDKRIALVVGTRNGDNYIKAGEIALSINKSGETGQYESTAYINADHVNISATQTAYTLAGDLEHDAEGRLVIKNAAGLYVKRDTAILGVWDRGNLTGYVMVQNINGQSQIKISADVIDIDGIVTSLEAKDVFVRNFNANNGEFTGTLNVLEDTTLNDVGCQDLTCVSLTIDGDETEWKSTTITHATGFSQQHYFLYNSGTGTAVEGKAGGHVATGWTTDTIYYLGKKATA